MCVLSLRNVGSYAIFEIARRHSIRGKESLPVQPRDVPVSQTYCERTSVLRFGEGTLEIDMGNTTVLCVI